MLEVLIHGFFGGGTSGFWGGQVVLVIHLSVGQVDFLTKFEPCYLVAAASSRSSDFTLKASLCDTLFLINSI